jgi:hypothetical protein
VVGFVLEHHLSVLEYGRVDCTVVAGLQSLDCPGGLLDFEARYPDSIPLLHYSRLHGRMEIFNQLEKINQPVTAVGTVHFNI